MPAAAAAVRVPTLIAAHAKERIFMVALLS
jgi:hypothetical protein